MLRALLVHLFRGLMRLYFSEVEELGARPDATTRGRLFVANHHNALIDPILVITCAPCTISPVAKSTLWAIPGLRWLLDQADAVPIVRKRDAPGKSAADNDAVFERVGAFLSRGGNLLIFPEGTSHNDPGLQRLRTGAARMLATAARAPEARTRESLTFQAVALEFESRETFRSRCVITYGPARKWADHATDDDGAVEAITARMTEDLSDLLVRGDSWQERRTMLRIAELLRADAADASFAELATRGRDVRVAKEALERSSPQAVAGAARAVDAYFDHLEALGLRDGALTAPGARTSLASIGRRLAFPIAALGALLYFLPYQVPRLVASREREADMRSTLKLGAGLLVFPLWATALAIAAFAMLPVTWAAAASALVLASPLVALDRLEHEGSLSAAFSRFRSRAALTALAEERAAALAAIEAARRHLDDGALRSSG